VGALARRVDFHTQAADKANKTNSDYAQRLLKAVYDIMAPKGQYRRHLQAQANLGLALCMLTISK
jgi:hypothetical protein